MFKKIKNLYHFLLAWASSVVYRRPSRNIFVLGITGTKGKSTVIELISTILEGAGKKTAFISSVRSKMGHEFRPNLTGMTMPGRFAIQEFINEAVERDCKYVLVEVTSQGVLQSRDRFIDFDAALFTNLEPEHIEAHGSFEDYRASKIRFFENVAKYSLKPRKLFFINSEARDNEKFAKAAHAGKDLPEAVNNSKVISYSKKDLEGLGLITKLLGDFNLENIAAAVAFVRSQKIDWGMVKNAIENFDGVPGRLEFVQKNPFSVVIDYAHTPDSLEKVYKALEEHKDKEKKMICVLGAAGGGRDVWKRPVMGQIASHICDEIILTNEDPFDDDPQEIVEEIAAGIENCISKKEYKIIMDRKQAIRTAIESAKKGDVVIITGKGSELFMRLAKGKKIPWSEREIVLDILNEETIKI